MSHQHITQRSIHFKWSRKLTPALTIASGTEVSFDLRDGGNNQITPENQATILDHLDFGAMDPGFGPVAVSGAEPGDVLRVDVLELTPGAYGWTAIIKDFGLLSDEFPEPSLKIWDLSKVADTGYASFKKGIRVPVRPFLGVMGLAPATDDELSTIPPYDWGGNMDCKHLTQGSTLWLPVQTPGALFSCGDGHAAQGDGEVCGTAIETPMRARLRFTLEKGRAWVRSPHYRTAEGAQPHADRGQEYAAMGLDKDLREATRKAVRAAIEWLGEEKGLERSEAYMLCSVVGDLKIVQAVDMPHYGVVCSIPLGIFVDE